MQIWLQQLVPQHFISRCVGKLSHCRCRWIKSLFIRWFIRRYRVNMEEAEPSDPSAYPDFNTFFTRPLKMGARPMPDDANAIISPVDGYISEIGSIDKHLLLQAKGHQYELNHLLGGDATMADAFVNGHFLTAYLSPKDYHRIHMPVAGRLVKMMHVPGVLFSVNPYTVTHVPELFAQNERVICLFETELGPMAIVLVGAIIVASIATVWHGVVTPPVHNAIQVWDYSDEAMQLDRGEEMGHFELGSTAIVLFGAGKIAWEASLKHNDSIRLGQTVAHRLGGAVVR